MAGNNFTENFTANVPVGIFQNVYPISTAVSIALHWLFDILIYTIFLQYCE